MKLISSVTLLLAFIHRNSGQLPGNGQDMSQVRPPIAFYRRSIMTQDRETIGSLGGAPVGLYRRRQSPYGQDFHLQSASGKPALFNQFKDTSNQFKDTSNQFKDTSHQLRKNDSIQNSRESRISTYSPPIEKSNINKIILDLLRTRNEKNLKSKLMSFGLGVSLGTLMGSLFPKDLLSDA